MPLEDIVSAPGSTGDCRSYLAIFAMADLNMKAPIGRPEPRVPTKRAQKRSARWRGLRAPAGAGAVGWEYRSTMAGGLTRTATVLVTDLVGSTEQRGRLGDAGADELRQRHDGVLEEAIAALGGKKIKGLGDGVLAIFESASDAFECAVVMHQRLSGFASAEPFSVRIGLAAGDVSFEDDDVFGTPVVQASRVCADAAGGQILCTDLVRALAGSRSQQEFRVVGERSLKGLEPILLHEVLWSRVASNTADLPAFLTATATFPFVGRHRERLLLGDRWEACEGGKSATVLIAGEPGVGKTRLAAELARDVHGRGGVVVAGRCDEEINSPYQPFVEALRQAISNTDSDALSAVLGRYGGDLVRLIPELAEHADSLPAPLQADAESEQARLMDAIVVWLQAMAMVQPVLVVLDDLHWADKASTLVLRHIVRSLHDSRVLVVGTYRDTDVDRTHPLADTLADLRGEAGVERVALRGLDAEEVLSFLEGAAGHTLDTRSELAEALHAATEGNPFFVEEVVRHLVETGRIYEREGVWTTDVESVDDLELPQGIREVVGRRLTRLGAEHNDVLAKAAVLGPRFDVVALTRMYGDRDAVLAALDSAESAGMVLGSGGRRADYAFAHALVRQTLLEEISLARRQRFHVEAADAIETTKGSAGAIAVHLRRAGAAADPERAVAASVVAAQEARRTYAWAEASEHLEAAVELLDDTGGEPAVTARLLELVGDATYASDGGGWERGIDHLERARDIYEHLGDPVRAAKVRSRIGRNLSTFPGRQDIPRALENLTVALEILEPLGASTTLAYVHIALASVHGFTMEPDGCAQAAERALAIGTEFGHQTIQVNARMLRAAALTATGSHTEGMAELEEAHHDAVALGQPILAYVGAFIASSGMELRLDPMAAIERIDREIESGRYASAPGLRATLERKKFSLLGHTGALREMEALFDQLSPTYHDTGYLEYWRGDFSAAAPLLDAWLALERDGSNFGATAWGTIARAAVAERTDRIDEAETFYDTVLQLTSNPRVINNISIAALRKTCLLARHSRSEDARRLLAQWAPRLDAADDLRGIGGFLHLARALMSTGIDEAAPHFEAAVRTFRLFSLPFYEAEAFEDWGHITAQPAHLDAALDIYDRLGVNEEWKTRARHLRQAASDRSVR